MWAQEFKQFRMSRIYSNTLINTDRRILNLSQSSSSSSSSRSSPGNLREKWLRLPFLGKASNRLVSELKHFGFRVGFYPLRTVGNLSSLKDRESRMAKSGVYKASCGSCSSIYIGQTARKLSTRLQEHKTKRSSAVFSHCIESGHDPAKINIKLLHQCNKGRVMNAMEEIETIKAASPDLLNDFDAVLLHKFIRFYYNYNDNIGLHDN